MAAAAFDARGAPGAGPCGPVLREGRRGSSGKVGVAQQRAHVVGYRREHGARGGRLGTISDRGHPLQRPVLRRRHEQYRRPERAAEGLGDLRDLSEDHPVAGREELRRWLAAPPDIPQPRDPLLVKVFFGRQADPAVLAAHLKMWRAHYAGLLRRYEEEIAPLIHHYADLTGACEDACYWSLTLEFGRRFAQMVVNWCDTALAAVMQEGKAHG